MSSLRLVFRVIFLILATAAVINSKPVIEDEEDLAEDVQETVIEEQFETQTRCDQNICGEPEDIASNGCEEFCVSILRCSIGLHVKTHYTGTTLTLLQTVTKQVGRGDAVYIFRARAKTHASPARPVASWLRMFCPNPGDSWAYVRLTGWTSKQDRVFMRTAASCRYSSSEPCCKREIRFRRPPSDKGGIDQPEK
ncbi:hypothetical protein PoB_001448500 [Plakobranchus ocellatus]|uniref:Uncharacterized protein n=1 Tax=Plakobranchus ocellatus TaxID=259542 RepID=A0AAV3YXP4_9GAST|nr:hypothetical protein PoB_001448500 [Plakobranchus ocellatus]